MEFESIAQRYYLSETSVKPVEKNQDSSIDVDIVLAYLAAAYKFITVPGGPYTRCVSTVTE